MRGTLYIHVDKWRATRKAGAALLVADVIGCSGDFQAGDKVHLVTRGKDGGQSVVATGIVRCNASLLRAAGDGSTEGHRLPVEDGDADIVIQTRDIELPWPSDR